jgi:CRP/FNR family transcriptional regulator, transcriptional activator FtrB
MGVDPKTDPALQNLPLFKGLAVSKQAELGRNAVQHRVAAGTVLFEQGDVPNFQHVVLSGAVQLFGRSAEGREVLIETVEAPDLVIPAAVMMGAPYLMRATAPVSSHFLLIHAAAFRAAVASDPALAQVVIGSLAGQFRRMVRQIKNLKLRTASQRAGCYLLALSKRQGASGRVTLPYGKNLIASELGITRESFSRALAALHDTGGIRVEGDTVFILDPARLAADCMPDPLIDDAEGAIPPLEAHSAIEEKEPA